MSKYGIESLQMLDQLIATCNIYNANLTVYSKSDHFLEVPIIHFCCRWPSRLH